MSAPVSGKFQDHYKILGIDPAADSTAIQDAYSKLAAKYHASTPETADPEQYKAVTLAYEVLADPAGRKAFDEVRGGPVKEEGPRFEAEEFFRMLDVESLRRQTILCVLFDRRRQNPLRPSLSLKQLENLIDSTQDEIQFSVWYLKQKGHAISDDKSNTQIAVPGIDFLGENPPRREAILRMMRKPEVPAEPEVQREAPPEPPPSKPVLAVEAPPKPLVAPGPVAPKPSLNLPRRTIVIPPRPN